jgi:PknH-like protein
MRTPAIALLGVCLVAGACSTNVEGNAVKDTSPSVSRPLDQVLPTTGELSTALSIGPTGFMGQLVKGGPDMLLQEVDSAQASPPECVSATYRLQKAVYDTSAVTAVATRSWAGGDAEKPAFSGYFGVVELDGADDAKAFFASTADKWRRCDGDTMTLRQHAIGAPALTQISDVSVDDGIVSAVLTHDPGASDSQTVERALGVGANCIVDVEITDLNGQATSAGGAVAVAKVMLGKLG